MIGGLTCVVFVTFMFHYLVLIAVTLCLSKAALQ